MAAEHKLPGNTASHAVGIVICVIALIIGLAMRSGHTHVAAPGAHTTIVQTVTPNVHAGSTP
jgi:hypothetical protein